MWPLVLYAALVAVIVTVMLGLSAVLGERHSSRTRFKGATGEPYEGGVIPVGSARLRFSPRFYLVAMFFVIFDLEAAFLYAWAISARDVGWAGFASVVVFVVLLLAALLYLARIGALDFGPRPRHLPPTADQKGRTSHALVPDET